MERGGLLILLINSLFKTTALNLLSVLRTRNLYSCIQRKQTVSQYETLADQSTEWHHFLTILGQSGGSEKEILIRQLDILDAAESRTCRVCSANTSCIN
jgi:hypothetical protein